MRVCLFDWNAGGHHAEIAKAFIAALDPGPEVVLAASDATIAAVGDVPAATHSLGPARPRLLADEYAEGPSKAELAERELDLLEETVRDVAPDHLVLLWGEPVLRWLLRRPPLPMPVSLYVAFSRLHYPRLYGTRFGAREWASALFKELNLLRWARRPDSHAFFCIDEAAASRLDRYPGARAYGLGEPPLSDHPDAPPIAEKDGCILFGHLDQRKGIDRLAAALENGCEGLRLRLYGEPAPEYREQLEREVERMRAGGVEVETRLERLPYDEALESIGRSRVALLSFGWIPVGSRVLLEAATMGTPVIGSNLGAVDYLVRTHGLGLTVDPADPAALRRAILGLASDPSAPERYAASLGAYATELSVVRYRRLIRSAFGLEG
jgi:glycosyltransferase involved in cell wall biosynthesis